MGFHVVGVEIVAVVGGHEGEIGGVGKLKNALVHERLFRQAVGLHFQIEAVGKKRGVFLGYGNGVVEGAAARDELVLPEKCAGQLAGHTGRKRHQAVGAAVKHFFVDARLVVKAVEPAAAHQMHEVAVADGILRQKNEVMPHSGEVGCLVGVIAGDIDFAADDGRNAHVLAGGIKIGGAEKVAVIGNGGRGHAERLGLLRQIGDPDGAVEEAEFGMAM